MKTVCFALVLSVLLSSCGGGKDTSPDDYVVGEESLPAVEIEDEDVSFHEKLDSETQQTCYIYEKLESTEDILSQYVDTLQKDYECVIVDEDGMEQSVPDLSSEDGEMTLGTDCKSGDGAFLLQIQWTPDSLTVTPMVDEDMKIQKESSPAKTLDEIVQIFENVSPAQLDLPGESMKDYTIYPEEGYVFINQTPCIRLNIYQASTHSFEKTFVVSADGTKVYELNRDTNQLTPITL